MCALSVGISLCVRDIASHSAGPVTTNHPEVSLKREGERKRMKDRAAVAQKILEEVSQDDDKVRDRFLGEFRQETGEFAQHMADALLRWITLIEEIAPDKRANENISEFSPNKNAFFKSREDYVAAFVYSAIALHIESMQLFLSGHMIAAGNLMRQVLESIAMALLCSSPSLGILDKFIRGHFSTQKSIPELIKHANKLGLNKEAVKGLLRVQKVYHKYSHLSNLTLTSFLSLETKADLYIGCSFDEGKVAGYRAGVASRVAFAKVFSNFVELVSRNISSFNKTSAAHPKVKPDR
jgi:hypothetical protein